MHKTVSITLGGLLFHVEEHAYTKLESYLQEVRVHFSTYEDSEEILSDIESRIAEEFSAKITKSKTVITLHDVSQLIKHMGTVKDFKEFDSDHHVPPHSDKREEKNPRKLYRDMEHHIIGGVAAGLGNYLGIDPMIIRLAFILSTFAGGYGVILYLILWMIIPDAKTPGQRAEMRGEALKLKTINEKIHSSVARAKIETKKWREENRYAGDHISTAMRKIIAILTKILLVFARIIGAFIVLGTSIALFALTFAFMTLLFSTNGLPVRDIFGSYLLFLLLAIPVYITVFIPLLLIALAGSSLARMRSIFSVPLTVTLFAVWLIAVMTAGVTAASNASFLEENWQTYHEQNMQTETKEIDVTAFSIIESNDALRLNIHQGDALRVTATGGGKDIDSLIAQVTGDRLTLQQAHTRKFCFFCMDENVVVDITLPELTELTLGGATRATLNIQELQKLLTTMQGASRLELTGIVEDVRIDASGASRVTLEGSGSLLTATLNGASRLDADTYSVQTADIKAGGASRALLYVTRSLKAIADGASRISYIGQPSEVIENASDASRIEKIDTIDSDDSQSQEDWN